MKLIIIFTLFIQLLYSNQEKMSNEELIEMGYAASNLFKSTLKGKMKEALNNFANANENSENLINFCSKEANIITKGVNELLPSGIKIRRASIKNRSKENDLEEIDIEPLKHLKEILNKKEIQKKYIFTENNDVYKMYVPIILSDKLCLKCHGKKNKIPSSIQKTLDQKYPKDKAIGFKIGELRGVFIIDIDKDEYK